MKQADTVMLTYPLNWNMSHDIMRNDLDYYALLMDPDPPALTWSWFTVGYKMVKEELKMISYFTQSYQDYMQDPFKVRKYQSCLRKSCCVQLVNQRDKRNFENYFITIFYN